MHTFDDPFKWDAQNVFYINFAYFLALSIFNSQQFAWKPFCW